VAAFPEPAEIYDAVSGRSLGNALPSRAQLGDKAAAYVRELILTGSLRPGEVVQPAAIATALGISVTPVREALQTLRVAGFLIGERPRGFQVAPLDGQDIRDLFMAHALIFGELAARTARRLTTEDLTELEALFHELCAAARRADRRLLDEKNVAFYWKIVDIADAPKLLWVLRLLELYVPNLPLDGFVEITQDAHAELLAHFRAGDAEGARATLSRHNIRVGELIAASFERARNDELREPEERP
jgi:DNA-binding GntR family transcriptional regulator